MAILPLPIHYSREARAYILALFLAAISTWLWVRLLQRQGDPVLSRGFWAYAAIALLGAFSHFHFTGVLVAHAVMALFWRRASWRRSILRLVTLGALFLLLLAAWLAFTGVSRQQALVQGSGPSGDRPGWLHQLPEFLGALTCIDFVGDLPTIKCRSPLGLVTLAAMLACATAVFLVWRAGSCRRAVLVSLTLFVTPTAFMMASAVALDVPRYAAPIRFSIFNQIGLSLVLGLAALVPAGRWLQMGVLVLMTALAAHYQLRWAEVSVNPPGGGYLLALGNYSRVVRSETEWHASDGPLLFPDWAHLLMWSVYDTGPTSRMPMTEIRPPSDRRPELEARVHDFRDRYERVRVVHQLDIDPTPYIEPVERYFALESTRTDAGVSVRTYRRAP
jgi:uncharacterized membrane protein